MKKRQSRRREQVVWEMTINGRSVDEHLKQIPEERWDGFLQLLARIIAKDLRDYPDLPGDHGQEAEKK